MEDEPAGNSPIVPCFRAIDGEMRDDPIPLHHSERDSALNIPLPAILSSTFSIFVRERGEVLRIMNRCKTYCCRPKRRTKPETKRQFERGLLGKLVVNQSTSSMRNET